MVLTEGSHTMQTLIGLLHIAQGLRLDLNRFDGMSLKVLGDGQTFKVNLKTADQDNFPESTYQTTFDTTEGMAGIEPGLTACSLWQGKRGVVSAHAIFFQAGHAALTLLSIDVSC